jgi:hypothetical protein
MCDCMNSLHACLLTMSMYYLNMYSSMYIFIYLLLIDDAWKKEKNSHVVPSLIFKIQCTT